MTRDALTAAGLFDSQNFYLLELISSFYIFPVRPFSLSFSLSFCVCSYASRMSLYTRVNTLILWRASTAKGLQLFREIERCCMSWPCAVLFCFSFLFYGKKNNSATRAFVVGTGALFFFVQTLLRCMSAAAVATASNVRKCCNEITCASLTSGGLCAASFAPSKAARHCYIARCAVFNEAHQYSKIIGYFSISSFAAVPPSLPLFFRQVLFVLESWWNLVVYDEKKGKRNILH